MSINEMEVKVNELRELKRMAEELAAEITTLEDSIKAAMTANPENANSRGVLLMIGLDRNLYRKNGR